MTGAVTHCNNADDDDDDDDDDNADAGVATEGIHMHFNCVDPVDDGTTSGMIYTTPFNGDSTCATAAYIHGRTYQYRMRKNI